MPGALLFALLFSFFVFVGAFEAVDQVAVVIAVFFIAQTGDDLPNKLRSCCAAFDHLVLNREEGLFLGVVKAAEVGTVETDLLVEVVVEQAAVACGVFKIGRPYFEVFAVVFDIALEIDELLGSVQYRIGAYHDVALVVALACKLENIRAAVIIGGKIIIVVVIIVVIIIVIIVIIVIVAVAVIVVSAVVIGAAALACAAV